MEESDDSFSLLPLALHNECVVFGKGDSICLLRGIHEKSHISEKDWKVYTDKSKGSKLATCTITCVSVCKPTSSSGDFDYLLAIGHKSGLILLAGIDSHENIRILSKVESVSSEIRQIRIDSNLEDLYVFALDATGGIAYFSWKDPSKTRFVSCCEKVAFFSVSLRNGIIGIFGEFQTVLKFLESETVICTLGAMQICEFREYSVSWHPRKNLLCLGGLKGVRYICHPRWEIYRFGELEVHLEQIDGLQFSLCGDLVVLLTASKDRILIWDFDTESIMYSNAVGYSSSVCALLNPIGNQLTLAIFSGQKLETSHQSGVWSFGEFWKTVTLSLSADETFVEVCPRNPSKSEVSAKSASSVEPKAKRLKKLIDSEAKEVELFKSPLKQYEKDDYFEEIDERYENISVLEEFEKLQKRISVLESRISQRPLVPGSCPPPNDESAQWLLYWDEIGQVTKQTIGESGFLHVHIFMGPLAGYVRKPDRYNCHTAALAQRGLVSGSDIEVENGQIQAIVAYTNLETNDGWDRRLKDESIALVAISEEFLTALTFNGVLYIFSIAGSLLATFRLKGAPVGMAARGNMLATVSEVYSQHKMVLSVRIFWINGLRGLAKNPISRIIGVYNDILVLPRSRYLKWLNLSKNYIFSVADNSGELLLLLPSVGNLESPTGSSLDWVPFTNLKNFAREENQQGNIRIFPLYINDFTLFFIKLRKGQKYPASTQPVNFMGYTLRKAMLRIEGVCGKYLPNKQFQSLIEKDPLLREISGDDIVAEVAAIPWQQYDEMRHNQSLCAAQQEFVLRILQRYLPWSEHSDFLTALGNAERAHDKWLLRVLRKVKNRKQELTLTHDVFRMLRFPKCLEAAANILGNQMDPLQRRILQDSAAMLAYAPGFQASQPTNHLTTNTGEHLEVTRNA